MTLNVKIQEAGTHLSIKAEGPYTLENLYNLLDTVKEESDRRAKKVVILDTTGWREPSPRSICMSSRRILVRSSGIALSESPSSPRREASISFSKAFFGPGAFRLLWFPAKGRQQSG